MKSNIEYLKDDIAKASFMPAAYQNQLLEWVDAIEEELNGDGTNEGNDEDKDKTIEELEQEIESFKEDWIDPERLITIDFGYGEVQYVEPDNLKLQCLMDDFKEQHERSKQTLPAFQF